MVSKVKYYQMISAVAMAAASYILVPMLLKKNSDRLYKDRVGNAPDDAAEKEFEPAKPEDHRTPGIRQ